jgi:hypothetical protein
VLDGPRGHTLLTKTQLIIGHEGTTQRAEGGAAAAPGFETRDATLTAFDEADGRGGRASRLAATRPPRRSPTCSTVPSTSSSPRVAPTCQRSSWRCVCPREQPVAHAGRDGRQTKDSVGNLWPIFYEHMKNRDSIPSYRAEIRESTFILCGSAGLVAGRWVGRTMTPVPVLWHQHAAAGAVGA